MDRTVSCVILNYNDYKRTIDLTRQIIEFPTISHVIVVDNCSTDDSRIYLRQYNHKKFLLIESKINGGYGYGNNLGIRQAANIGDEFVIISNPDVCFDETCIEHMISCFDNVTDCGVISAKETYIGNYGWRYTSDLDDVLSASLVFNKLLKRRYYPSEYFENKKWAYVDIIPGCFLMTRTKEMNQFAMYDEKVFLYEEEKILYQKYINRNLKGVIDLEVSYEHRHLRSKPSVKGNIRSKRLLIKSKRYFLKEYRKFNLPRLVLSDIFFAWCIVEMFIYSFYCILRGKAC